MAEPNFLTAESSSGSARRGRLREAAGAAPPSGPAVLGAAPPNMVCTGRDGSGEMRVTPPPPRLSYEEHLRSLSPNSLSKLRLLPYGSFLNRNILM